MTYAWKDDTELKGDYELMLRTDLRGRRINLEDQVVITRLSVRMKMIGFTREMHNDNRGDIVEEWILPCFPDKPRYFINNKYKKMVNNINWGIIIPPAAIAPAAEVEVTQDEDPPVVEVPPLFQPETIPLPEHDDEAMLETIDFSATPSATVAPAAEVEETKDEHPTVDETVSLLRHVQRFLRRMTL